MNDENDATNDADIRAQNLPALIYTSFYRSPKKAEMKTMLRRSVWLSCLCHLQTNNAKLAR